MRNFILASTVLAGVFGAVSSAWAQDIEYRLNIEGMSRAQRNSVIDKLMLTTLRANPPSTSAALHRLAEMDSKTITTAMQAEGYFAAEVISSIDESVTPARVALQVKLGEQYTLRNVVVDWQGINADAGRTVLARADKDDFSFPTKEIVTPELLDSAVGNLLVLLRQNGFAEPAIIHRRIVLDHAKKLVTLELGIAPGRHSSFGETTFSGADNVDRDYIDRRINWEKGDTYDIRKVSRTQQDLVNSGVIGSVQVKTTERDRTATHSVLDMDLALTESLPRSIGAGAYISSNVGPYAQLFWEHRNIFGSAERLRLSADIGTERYGVGADLRYPDVFDNRYLTFETSFKHLYEELEAYDSKTTNVGGNFVWRTTDRITLTGGSILEYTEIDTPNEPRESFTLVSFPMGILYDSTEDLLDPTSGYRLGVRGTPTQSIDSSLSFLTMEYFGSIYIPLGDSFVWANRVKVANIQGASTNDIPADKRLYAGGGGSIRGYGYQMLGPRDSDNNPTGGRVLNEFGTEMRYRFADNVSFVGFLEAGRVTESADLSSTNGSFSWSAGVGARYHTVIGPIRFDVAVPLDKERGDDAFQFYISIGQAF